MIRKSIALLGAVSALVLGCASGPEVQEPETRPRHAKKAKRGWAAGEWHHLAFTYSTSGNFMRFYVDGVLVADTNEGHYWAPPTTGLTITIGGPISGDAAYYWLDEVRLSGRVADANEIAVLAQRLDQPRSNEVSLPLKMLNVGDSLMYEFTPATPTETGSAC